MSLESNLIPKSPSYAALRAYLRTKARVWVEQRTPATATNARRQLNQAFDAGVSATVEMLRELESLNLTEEEIETIKALRDGSAGVVAIRYPTGSRTGRLEPATVAPNVPDGVAVEERENEPASKTPMSDAIRRQTVCYPAPCDVDGREIRLHDRIVVLKYHYVGPGIVTWLSQDGQRVKMNADSNGVTYAEHPGCCRLIDGER